MTTDNEKLFMEVARFAAEHSVQYQLIWSGDLNAAVLVNDVFHWGSADAEEITADNINVFRQAVQDVIRISPSLAKWGAVLFAARVRGTRPQGAVFGTMNGGSPLKTFALRKLFLEFPRREVEHGNPYDIDHVGNVIRGKVGN